MNTGVAKVGNRVTAHASPFNRNKLSHDVDGTVERIFRPGVIGVRLDGKVNPQSQYGLYWFAPQELSKINGEEQIMLNNNFEAAIIRFLEGTNTDSDYYYALYDQSICVGDTVMVHTGHHGFALARVCHICDPSFPLEKQKVKCGREVVCKVDMGPYQQRRDDEVRAAKLKQAMDARVKTLQADAIYFMMAEKDPGLAAMLSEYQGLMGMAPAPTMQEPEPIPEVSKNA